MDEDKEIFNEFLIETESALIEMDNGLIELEKNPRDKELINTLFRHIHSIKGVAGFLELDTLVSVAHSAENLLDKLRNEPDFVPDEPIITAILQSLDVIRTIMANLSESGEEGKLSIDSLVKTLDELCERQVQADVSRSCETSASSKKSSGEHETSAAASEDKSSVLETTMRIDITVLDKMMDLVGELVLSRNQILTLCEDLDDSTFTQTCQKLNLVTTELQEDIMQARMQPIGNLWKQFPRKVRDLALACKKKVSLTLEGEETTLDKSIIEMIKDPLTHLIRNAIDHGLESPDNRVEVGKNETGQVTLKAMQENGHIVIEVSDDGGGINIEKVKARAVERQIVNNEEVASMTKEEIFNLLTMPGFSTAQSITNISGRGVGLDVVKANVEKIGGMLTINSVFGEGTSFKISIPLTLAIMPALLFKIKSYSFAIPQMNILEIVRVKRETIERLNEKYFYRLRGSLLPVADLAKTFKLKDEEEDKEYVNIIVLKENNEKFGVFADEIRDTEEIVIKPLAKQFRDVKVYSGITILGNGEIAPILDVHGVAQLESMIGDKRTKDMALESESQGVKDNRNIEHLLIFTIGNDRLMGLPLMGVERLEKVSMDEIEGTGQGKVIKYMGKILPIVDFLDLMRVDSSGKRDQNDNMLDIIVYNMGGSKQLVGIVVESIVDSVSANIDKLDASCYEGMIGMKVIKEKVTDIIDLKYLNHQVECHYPSIFKRCA